MNSSRLGGCTLTGAISVTSHIRDTVTVVHGPKGCSHHNASLLHAICLDDDRMVMPSLISTALGESEIIFGGEEALRSTIRHAAGRDVSAIFVLSTCIVDTIGDDTCWICAEEYGVPVIPIPTAGFLGGSFQDGMNNALIALAGIAEPCPATGGINLIGEMNLEYEVRENSAEISRLLSLLGLNVNLHFVHDTTFSQLSLLGAARLNILRSPSLVPVGEVLKEQFGTPYIPSFPHGLSGTLSFIRTVAGACGIDGQEAVSGECVRQEEMIAGFSDLSNKPVSLDHTLPCVKEIPATEELAAVLDRVEEIQAAGELAARLRLPVSSDGNGISLPVGSAIGTAGTRRMLHRWRRAIHA
ncbi:MAG: nitrogenase component 1 [Methanoregula sp.]|uniref:nitrogenase component 1 n=1 Tax=Methanoregula sp. TaxID=2052170 RepID=UPI0025D5FEFB|nr:nitrogenase component 1 [Methanoregula sp.]MCK9630502.1 nitrogenase component 1 [Methanoregula sp.]